MNIASIFSVAKNTVIDSAMMAKSTIVRYSPQILTGVSVAAGAGAVGTGIYAGYKLNNHMRNYIDDRDFIDDFKMSNPDAHKENIKNTVKKIAKDMALPAALGATSLVAGLSAAHILNQRLVTVTAAYTGLLASYNAVVDENAQLRKGVDAPVEKKEEIVEEKKEDKPMDVGESPYVVEIGPGHPIWRQNPQDRYNVLKMREERANTRLYHYGKRGMPLLLNEVLDVFDCDHTNAGMICGWSAKIKGSDPYISCGITGCNQEESMKAYLSGESDTCKLHFNCAGVVYGHIDNDVPRKSDKIY